MRFLLKRQTEMDESRFGKSKRNIIAGLVQYGLNLFLIWLGRFIFVRVLSADYLGINGLFSNVISVLAIADLGIPTAMTYSLYKPIADGNTKRIASIVAFFRKIYLFIAFAVLITGLAVIPFIPHIVNLENPIPNLNLYYILILLNTVFSYLFIYRTTLMTADQKDYILQNYIVIFRVITFVCQIVVLLVFRNYLFYLAVGVIVVLVSNLVQNNVTLRHYPYLKEPADDLGAEDKRIIWKNVFDLFLYRLCGIIQNNTDSILISFFAGTVFVGYYSNYQAIVLAVTAIINIVFNSVKASLGNLFAGKDASPEKKRDAFWTMELVNFWMVAFCSTCFICLFQSFIGMSFGGEYVIPMGMVIAIVLNFYTSNIRQSIWAFRETMGFFHEVRMITAVTAVLNIVLSVVMGYFWGMFGVLAATVIARMVYAWWKEPVILFNGYLESPVRKYFITYLLRFLLFAVICAAAFFACGVTDYVPNPIIAFVLKMFICLVLPNGILWLVFHKNRNLHELMRRLVRFRQQ